MIKTKICVECGKLRDGASPYWCIECNKKRIAKITAQLETIAHEFGIKDPWGKKKINHD